MSSSSLYTINGIKVEFPCKAYPSQLSMMDKIIKGIDRQQNCLLESPTGSGKSLALLCSALAWQTSERDRLQGDNAKAILNCCCCNGTSDSGFNMTSTNDQSVQDMCLDRTQHPDNNLSLNSVTSNVEKDTIIVSESDSEDDFKSDTKRIRSKKKMDVSAKETDSPKHAMQAEKEVGSKSCDCSCSKGGRSKQRLPKIYFGTRTHKQVAQILRELRKTAYSKTKMTILSSREHTCIHPSVIKSSSRNEECKNLMDGGGCSFYDRVRRIFLHPCLENSGLGDAWDIEDLVKFAKKRKACSYFGARQLCETADIIFCPYNYLIDPMIRKSMDINLNGQIVLLDEAHNIEDSSREAASFSLSLDQLQEAASDLNRVAYFKRKPAEHTALAQMCENLGQLIENQKSQMEDGGYDSASKVLTGTEIVAHLELVGLNASRLKELEGFLSAVSEKEDERHGQSTEQKMVSSTNALLDGVFMVLGFIYKENFKFIDDYRVAIVKMYTYKSISTDNKWLGKRKGSVRATWTFQLNFWCLNPAVAFNDMGCSTRCVILTSGTLSPITSFQSELGVVFPIQLEANHVIGNSQVWIACVSRGPSNQPLLGSYQNAETLSYQDEIGKTILQICQKVPFGVLCFLPSYKSMEKMTNRWKDVGILAQISRFKMILWEPRASDREDFDSVLQKYYEAVRKGGVENCEPQEDVNGALLFAVCRGKVSEGLDFSDDNARAVITVGIPYPNIRDIQVLQKKKYNDAQSQTKGLLCGSDWYEIQAYRALNQALGRCIRHRHDWGALILLDERFGKNPQKYTSGLSKWVRQRIQFFGVFSGAMARLAEFTKGRLYTNSSAEGIVSPPELHNDSITEITQQHHLHTSTPVANRLVIPMTRLSTNENSCIDSTLNHRMTTDFRAAKDTGPMTMISSSSTGKPLCGKSTNLQISENFAFSQAGGFIPASQFVSCDSNFYQTPEAILQTDSAKSRSKEFQHEQRNTDLTSYGSLNCMETLPANEVLRLELANNGKSKCDINDKMCSLVNDRVPVNNSKTDDFLPEEQTKPINFETCSERSNSPDLFDFVPTKIESEDMSIVLQEFDVEINRQEQVPSAVQITSEGPECNSNLIIDKKLSALSVLVNENEIKCGISGLKQNENLSDDCSEFQCSQLQKRKIRNDRHSFPTAENRQSAKKLKTLSRSKGQTARNSAVSGSKDSFANSTSPKMLSETAENIKVAELNDSMGLQIQKPVRVSRKKMFDDLILGSKMAVKKGVEFIDALDSVKSEKHEFGIISCAVCQTLLTQNGKLSLSYITRNNCFRASFWKALFNNSPSAAIMLVKSDFQKGAFACEVDEHIQGPLSLNSHWSEADRCCIQLLYCNSCKAGRKSTCLGIEVKAVSDASESHLHPDQVWLIPSCLKKS